MQYLKIGHATNTLHNTGVSVFLFERGAVAAYQWCGSSPATRELHALELESNVNEINGLVFSGGSAFGLGAIDGVMRYLNEQGKGKAMPHGGVVPIVPGAAIYDLAVGSAVPPSADEAYLACQAAIEQETFTGRIGAGTGASIGKIVPNSRRMSGGVGTAKMTLANGVEVLAYVVVNAVGDVRDEHGNIIAGACLANGKFGDCQTYLLAGGPEPTLPSSNTTLVSLFVNARFSKIELKRIAKMAVAGMAKAITPVFTRYDGDMVFCVSLGDHSVSELVVGAMAVEAVRQAIVNAVKGSVKL